MNRLLTLVGGVAAVGLAVATAGWKPVAVAHDAGHNRRGRLEFRHETAVADAGAAEEPTDEAGGEAAPETAPEAATQPEIPVEPETPVEPEPEPEPEPAKEPDIVSIKDVDLAVVENSFLPLFKVSLAVQLQIDSEGLVFWATPDKRTEMNSQQSIFTNIGSTANRDRELVIVPDQWTPWQYVKDTLGSADKAGTAEVFLGVADIENKTTLRLLRVMPSDPSDEAHEGDFVVRIEEGEDGPSVTADGVEVENFPFDLATTWSDWKKDHPDADASLGPNTCVVVDAHRFTPSSQVAQVIGVLRGLGIECERFVGSTSYGGRKRK